MKVEYFATLPLVNIEYVFFEELMCNNYEGGGVIMQN